MRKIVKNLVSIFIGIIFLEYFTLNPLNKTSLQVKSSEIKINMDDNYGIKRNIKEGENRYKTYQNEIIEKVREGRALEYTLKYPITVEDYYSEEYCEIIGPHSFIGSVDYPTWCNEDRGPFSIVKNSKSAWIFPLTVGLKKGYKGSLIDKLYETFDAEYIGVIKDHNYDPDVITGPNFKHNKDQLLGLVSDSKKRMMIWKISDLGPNSDLLRDIDRPKSSKFDLVIDLLNKKGEIEGGVSFGTNQKHCKYHKRNCLLNKIHLLEYRSKNHTPKVKLTREWGYVTGDAYPIHTLLEDYGSMKKIFLSRNYYLLIDITLNERITISSVRTRREINE
ncbi:MULTISPECIES: hypothetical protein [Prochlorococcus]|uniref:Uncharacterized protein n=1 Tax=Prochlorococcus marinus str. MIT 9116 TaxID=167544 RepID=A0A0A1ZUT5_PROMR|nr:hypothetical protein [Prochlorococcus marinus]KGF89820.1 hypothetical protein EU92_1611 [Prochlorococcus marinus str. MIT 9107]KGF92331.1 hypothetical protein EU93_0595 [Prochlorococcus marinus str. MIT 9116]KGF92649.1 hypothetical protein EU94_1647 [Prochlorococcus marinus str. MIT 9123]